MKTSNREETAKARGFSSLKKCMKVLSAYRNSTTTTSSATTTDHPHQYYIERAAILPPLLPNDQHWRTQAHPSPRPVEYHQPILPAPAPAPAPASFLRGGRDPPSMLHHMSIGSASRADPEPIKSVVSRRLASQEPRRIGEHAEVIGKLSNLVYPCKDCDRTFTSFQALGGHRASHTKPRVSMGEDGDQDLDGKPKLHQCNICGQEFQIGQALGGHMRRHRDLLRERRRSASSLSSSSPPSSSTPSPPPLQPQTPSTPSPPPLQDITPHGETSATLMEQSSSSGKRVFDFDLNLPYEETDEQLELSLGIA